MKLLYFMALAVLVEYAGAHCINSSDPQYENITFCDSAGCSGSCYPDNDCSCIDYTLCVPNANTACPDPTLCCPDGLFYNKNQSCCSTTPLCEKECVTDEECSPLGECQCNATLYQNLALKDFHPTIKCESITITVTVSTCELEALGLDPSTIHLRDSSAGCNSTFADSINGQRVTSVQTRVESNWCGNTVTGDNSSIYIFNTIYIGVLDKPIITRNNISFNFTCAYERNMQTVLKLPGNITQQTVYLPNLNGDGSYPVTMAAYKDPSFTEGYQNSDLVTVGSIIYVGIFVTGADGSQFDLRIESCVASPTNARNDTNAFYLIKYGCVQGSVSTTVIKNGISLEASFSISSFQFQNQADVYLFCDVRLCDKKNETCSKCASAKSVNTATREIAIGLKMDDNLNFADSAGKNTVASWALLAGIQLAIVFVKFI